jgi:hypothetical protein
MASQLVASREVGPRKQRSQLLWDAEGCRRVSSRGGPIPLREPERSACGPFGGGKEAVLDVVARLQSQSLGSTAGQLKTCRDVTA